MKVEIQKKLEPLPHKASSLALQAIVLFQLKASPSVCFTFSDLRHTLFFGT